MKKAKTMTVKKVNPIAAFFKDSAVKWYDWAILGALVLFCFLVFQMRDLLHTAGCSYGYLNGHVWDFYDYLAAEGIDENGLAGLHASYLPTTYFIFAIWNLPMKIFGIVKTPSAVLGLVPVMWAKLLPAIVYFMGAFVFFRIGKELGLGDRKAKIATYAYVTVPMALFGQFILGQYESFLVFSILMGTYFWLKKKPFWFVFWFTIGMTFKYTAILFFLPLLLLREKNFWKILLQFLGALSLTAVEILFYWHSPSFREYGFGIGSSATPVTSYAFNASYETGFVFTNVHYSVYLVIIALALVMAYSYFLKPKSDEEERRYAVFLPALSFAAMFCFTKWHAHWLMTVIPFWTLGAFMTRHTKIWLILELFFMVLFAAFNVQFFQFFHDEALLTHGIFKNLLPNGQPGNSFNMIELFGIVPGNIVLSLLTALILIFAVFRHPKFMVDDLTLSEERSLGWLRARYVIGLLVFIVPAMIALATSIRPANSAYSETRWEAEATVNGQEIAQPFTANGDTLKKLVFRLVTDETNEGAEMTLKIADNASGETPLYEKTYRVSDYNGGERIIVKPKLELENGKTYYLVLSAEGCKTDEAAEVMIARSAAEGLKNALVDGKEADFRLTLDVYD